MSNQNNFNQTTNSKKDRVDFLEMPHLSDIIYNISTLVQMAKKNQIINALPILQQEPSDRTIQKSGLFIRSNQPENGYSAEGRARILYGAPGSGKSYNGLFKFLQKTAWKPGIVSFDEMGSIYNNHEFISKLTDLTDIEPAIASDQFRKVPATLWSSLHALWRAYQADSQDTRNLTEALYLQMGADVIVDTTATNKGVLLQVNNYHGLGKTVEFDGYAAPFDISEERILTRPRPTSYIDLIAKHVDAWEMLSILAVANDSMTMHWNPDDTSEPQIMFTIENGRVVTDTLNRELVSRAIKAAETDVKKMISKITEIRKNPEKFLLSAEEAANLPDENKMRQAYTSYKDALRTIRDHGHVYDSEVFARAGAEIESTLTKTGIHSNALEQRLHDVRPSSAAPKLSQ